MTEEWKGSPETNSQLVRAGRTEKAEKHVVWQYKSAVSAEPGVFDCWVLSALFPLPLTADVVLLRSKGVTGQTLSDLVRPLSG